MERYEKFKDSGVEWSDRRWIGGIPEHWEIKKIKYVAYLKSGDNIISEQINESDAFPVFGGNGLRGYFSDFTHEGNFVLIGRQGALCGNINYASGKFWASEHAIVCHLQTAAGWKWFGELLKIMNLNQYSQSAAQPGLAVEKIKNLEIPYPPLFEQTAIANYLDKKTSELDTLITKKENLIELLKEERTAIINQAVTKGLDPDVEMKDSGVDGGDRRWLGEIPAHWEVKKLKYVFQLVGGFAFKSEDFTDEGIQLIKIGNLYQNKLQLDRQPTFLPTEYKETFKDYMATKGDILLSLTGTLGKRDYGYAILIDEDKDLLVNQRVAKISVKGKMDIDFSINLFQCETYLNQLLSIPTGTKQGNLSGDDVLGIHMPIPSIDEQLEIALFIKNEDSRITNIILLTNQEITLLKEYKTALISEVVTGKVKVV
ncbi:MAG: restriction endonuclease subunit S [Dyadobacter sp.]